jgi:hypothetical protein
MRKGTGGMEGGFWPRYAQSWQTLLSFLLRQGFGGLAAGRPRRAILE